MNVCAYRESDGRHTKPSVALRPCVSVQVELWDDWKDPPMHKVVQHATIGAWVMYSRSVMSGGYDLREDVLSQIKVCYLTGHKSLRRYQYKRSQEIATSIHLPELLIIKIF